VATLLAALVIAGLALVPPALAQDCPELAGRWPYGPAYSVAVFGSHAFFGSGTVLVVADVSNAAEPLEVGEVVLSGIVWGVAASGNYAYVAADGLRVIDVSTPASPIEVGFLETPGGAFGVAVSGNYAYVAEGYNGLRVIDVSTPASPIEVGLFDTPGNAEGVAVSGNYAYIADGDQGLKVIDVSDPTDPDQVGSLEIPGIAGGVAVSGNDAYVTDGRWSGITNDVDDGLRVIDVSTPASPIEVGFFDPPGYTRGVAVSGSYAYVTNGNFGVDDGLRVIDVSTPASPIEVGFLDTSGPNGVAVSGGYAYVADNGAGLRVIDVSDPTGPSEVSILDTPGWAHEAAVSGSQAYVASDHDGLWVIDVSGPSNPFEVGYLDFEGPAQGVAVSGSYAYVAAHGEGLLVIDVSTPESPSKVGSVDTLGYAWDVAVSGSYAYVTNSNDGLCDGLWVIDVSIPASPTEVGFFEILGDAQDVAVSGSYAYVTNSNEGFYDGLWVIDVATPASPIGVGFFDTPGHAQDVAVSGNYAYVADWDGGLRVIDVSTPSNPIEVGFFLYGLEPASGVAVSGSYAYVTWTTALRVIDVSDPLSPAEVGHSDTPGDATDVTYAGGRLYVAESNAGMEIFWECGVKVFADGFESGDTSAWSGFWSRKVEVVDSAARSGNFGLRVTTGVTCSPNDLTITSPPLISGDFEACNSITVSGVEVVSPGATFRAGSVISLDNDFSVASEVDFTAVIDPSLPSPFAWVQDDSPTAETTYKAVFYSRLDALNLAIDDELDHFVGYSSNGDAQFRLVLRKDPILIQDRLAILAREDGGAFVEYPSDFLLPAGYNRIEIAWRAGAGDGEFLVSINGAPLAGLTGLNNNGSRIDFVKWGAVGGTLTSTTGAMELDEFVSLR
jgi:hypothetical protein